MHQHVYWCVIYLSVTPSNETSSGTNKPKTTTTAATPTKTTTNKTSPLGPGEIVGIVIGVLVLIAIVGVVVWYVKKVLFCSSMC
ncbi:hypothetical protein AC249_AIPGENE15058 [Exaiptasia diaphana]|nr:hypothetical protein AC249_AIPGENE15058 [Exaiptasia diaphana]